MTWCKFSFVFVSGEFTARACVCGCAAGQGELRVGGARASRRTRHRLPDVKHVQRHGAELRLQPRHHVRRATAPAAERVEGLLLASRFLYPVPRPTLHHPVLALHLPLLARVILLV